MPDRYWVGGTGTWSSTNTANWSESSGGATGASVPTADDDVFFDANSNTGTSAFTVTIALNYSALCKNFTVSGLDGVMTFTRATGGRLYVYGSWSSPTTNFTFTVAMNVFFAATTTGHTIAMESSAKASGSAGLLFVGAGGEWTFTAEPIRVTSVEVSAGTLKTNGYALNITGAFQSIGTTTRAIEFGSSVVSLSNSTSDFTITGSNITFDAGTSNVRFLSSGHTLRVIDGLTFYNIEMRATVAGGVIARLVGSFTVNDWVVSVTSTAASRGIIEFGYSVFTTVLPPAQVTVNGTLQCDDSPDVRRRVLFRTAPDYIGLQEAGGEVGKLTCNGSASLVNVDFGYIDVVGTAAPLSGTSIGNFSGVTGVTFTAAKTCYLRGTSGGQNEWHDNVWSATSGASAALANFPLGQDTVIIDDNTLSAELEFNAFDECGSACQVFDASTRTTSFTIDGNSGVLLICGDDGEVILPSNISFATSAFELYVYSTSTCSFDIAPTLTRCDIIVTAPDCLTTLDNDLTITGVSTTDRYLRFRAGNFDLNGYDITVNRLWIGGSSASYPFDSSTIEFNGGSLTVVPGLSATAAKIFAQYGENYTFPDNGVIVFSGTSASATAFDVLGGCPDMRVAVDGSIAKVRFAYDFKALDLDSFTGEFSFLASVQIYGDLVFGANVTFPAGASTGEIEFVGTGQTTITDNSAGGYHGELSVEHTGAGALTLLSDVTTISDVFVDSGRINLNGFDITCRRFFSSEDADRVIDIGTPAGGVFVTGNAATVATVGYGSRLSYPNGRLTVSFTYSGSTGTRTISSVNSTEAGAANYAITAGSDTVALTASSFDVDFTGFSGTLSGSARTVWGDFTVSPTMTVSGGSFTLTFAGTSGTQVLTTNGVALDLPITKSGAGTLQLGSNLNNATRTFTLSEGTVDDAGYDISIAAISCTGSLTRSIAFNGGAWTASNSGSVATFSGSNFSTSGSGGTLSLTSSIAKTFAGGGFDFSSMTLNQGGAGTLTIAGNNTFRDWSATTIAQFTVSTGTTQTFQNFTLSGTSGSPVLIRNSSTAGSSTHTLSKASGTVNVDYLNIQRSTAAGGATWYAGANSTDSGNNTGWIFSAAPAVIYSGKFFQLFNWA